jgi:hypothetical protein
VRKDKVLEQGADMKTRGSNPNPRGLRVDLDVAAACKPIEMAGGRRARLLVASALAGGALRGLAIAAGMVTVFGAAPAFAACTSGATGNITTAACNTNPSIGAQATAVGTGAMTGPSVAASAYGFNANVFGTLGTAIGSNSNAGITNVLGPGERATAIGANSNAIGERATATGQNSQAIGATASAFGQGSVANGDATTAIGQVSTANATGATAVGQSTIASGARAFAGGIAANASGASAVALGDSAQATASGAVAVGLNAGATGTNAIAIGNGAASTGSVAVGTGASAANGGAAFGDGTIATGSNATAIGPGASATFANSSAIGAGASATAANQMAFGTASNTYRMPGITSAASLAAQSGPTSFVTTDANGNLAATGFGPQQMVQGMQSMAQSINVLAADVSVLQENLQHGLNQAYEGTAIAIAMSGSALPDNKRFAITSNWGNFRGTNAMSLIAQARVSDNIVANAGFAGGFQYRGWGSRAGLTFAW